MASFRKLSYKCGFKKSRSFDNAIIDTSAVYESVNIIFLCSLILVLSV